MLSTKELQKEKDFIEAKIKTLELKTRLEEKTLLEQKLVYIEELLDRSKENDHLIESTFARSDSPIQKSPINVPFYNPIC